LNKKPSNTLRFPILNEVDYIDFNKERKTIISFTGDEVEGLTWRQLQLKLGESVNEGRYNFTLKFKGSDVIHRGVIKAIKLNKNGTGMDDEKDISQIKKTIDDLNKKLAAAGNNSPSTDLLISITRQGYETQINFLNLEIGKKDRQIEKLETKIEKLEDELNEYDEIVEDLKSKSGAGQYLAVVKDFLMMKAGNAKPIESLKDSNPDDIPGEILQVLGVVDWSKVNPELQTEIIHYLKIFIQKLPLK